MVQEVRKIGLILRRPASIAAVFASRPPALQGLIYGFDSVHRSYGVDVVFDIVGGVGVAEHVPYAYAQQRIDGMEAHGVEADGREIFTEGLLFPQLRGTGVEAGVAQVGVVFRRHAQTVLQTETLGGGRHGGQRQEGESRAYIYYICILHIFSSFSALECLKICQ